MRFWDEDSRVAMSEERHEKGPGERYTFWEQINRLTLGLTPKINRLVYSVVNPMEMKCQIAKRYWSECSADKLNLFM